MVDVVCDFGVFIFFLYSFASIGNASCSLFFTAHTLSLSHSFISIQHSHAHTLCHWMFCAISGFFVSFSSFIFSSFNAFAVAVVAVMIAMSLI